jgi:hypothetical protein
MKKNKIVRSLVLFLICIGCAQLVSAQNNMETNNDKTDNSWKFTVTPYAWLTGLNGNLTVLDQGVPVDLNFANDLLSNLKLAAMVHGEAKKNKFSFMVDAFYAKLGKDERVMGPSNNISDVRVRVKETLIEGGLGYTLAQTGRFSMDVLAGARFFDNSINVTIDDVEIPKLGFNFFDPYVGVRFVNDWNKWALRGRIDIGGFGLGSEYSYKFNGFVSYKFKETLVLSLGYQVFQPYYKEDLFEYKLANQGFLLGFTIGF